MKNIIIAFMLFSSLAIVESCYYENPPEPIPFECEDVSYSTHIQPILSQSCATSSCHDGTKEPDLRADASYNELKSGGYLNVVVPEESSLYKSVEWLAGTDPMPPGGPQIQELNRELILCWISKGAAND